MHDQAPPERADARKNRARILAATRTLLQSMPFEALCMDQVAHLAGVGKGTLYRRFPDRGALLLALLDDDERVLQEQVAGGCGATKADDAATRLLRLLDVLVDFHVDHAPMLAAAEARGTHVEHPAYVWRHRVIALGLRRCGLACPTAQHQYADMLLYALSGTVLVRALAEDVADNVKGRARAWMAAVVNAMPLIHDDGRA